MQKIADMGKAFLLAFSGLIVALGITWWIMAQMNFSYGFWHGYGGMAEGIDRLAKTNVQKFGFEKTTKEQREDLFKQIMDCIHNNGKGLEEITYKVDGFPEQTLLVESEVIHLNDVANLIQLGFYIVMVGCFVWGGLWFFYGFRGRVAPSLLLQIGTILLFVLVVVAVVFAIGPVPVFYQLHVWLFPEGHQWYFYFQKSLMATMMYAPNFFGWVAVEWLAISLPVFFALQSTVAFLIKKLQAR